MDELRHLTWANFAKIIDTGIPTRVRIPGQPPVEFLVAAGGHEVGMLLPTHPEELIPSVALEEILMRKQTVDYGERIYVSCMSERLFREFYSFMMSVADDIQLNSVSSSAALVSQLKTWDSLLKRTSLLSNEEEIGLFGELWVLQKLIIASGAPAMDAWVGPMREPHDFRFSNHEIEVKTTRSRERIHKIHGLDQLGATPGKRLFLLSLQVQWGGASGYTLRDMVLMVQEALRLDPTRRNAFDRLLEHAFGLNEANLERYQSTFELRTSPYLVEVEDNCPKLRREDLERLFSPGLSSRITAVEYWINLDDLGHPHGSPAFANILPI